MTRRGDVVVGTGKVASERRIAIVQRVFLCAFLVLIGRLFQLQILQGDAFEAAVRESRLVRQSLPPRRGDIIDRNGLALSRSVDSHTLGVYPSVFREGNRIDALTDLCAALMPDVLAARTIRADSVDGLKFRVDDRTADFESTIANADAWLRRLLDLSVDTLDLDGAAAARLIERQAWPAGTLILPPWRGGTRLRSAMLLLADRRTVPDLATLKRRMRETRTLGEALDTDAARTSAEMRLEIEEIESLARDALKIERPEFLARIFAGEVREHRYIDDRLRGMMDDRFAVERFGTHELEKLEPAERERLISQIAEPETDLEIIEGALEAFRTREPRDVGESAGRAAALEQLAAVTGARPLRRLEVYELRSVARIIGCFKDDPDTLKAGWGNIVRASGDYDPGEWITPLKEWQRRLQSKSCYLVELSRGCPFEIGNRVWATFGLRELGFSVEAGQSREYWGEDDGVLTLVLGRLSKSGSALGGLERSLEAYVAGERSRIVGTEGSITSLIDPDGGPAEVVSAVPPIHGETVELTLDRELVAESERILADMVKAITSANDPSGGAGACVLDIETGDVLLLATSPSLPGGEYLGAFESASATARERKSLEERWARRAIAEADYHREREALMAESDRKPFVERAVSCCDHGYYPPGSTMKCFVGLLALERGMIRADQPHVCGDKNHHGTLDLRGALAVSCNDYFWDLGKQIGRDDLVDWYRTFGLFGEVPALMAADSGRARERNTAADSAKNLAIGEGSIQTSPLEVATMFMNLARHGRIIAPRIVRSIGGVEIPTVSRPDRPVSPANVDAIIAGMRASTDRIVQREKRLLPYVHRRIAGKTGTAEGYVGRHAEENLAWFAGVAPYDQPRFAFAVFCEHTNFQGRHVPIYAAQILDACFKRCAP